MSARKQRLIQSNLLHHHHGIRAEPFTSYIFLLFHSWSSYQIFEDSHGSTQYWVQVIWIPVFFCDSFMKYKLVYLYLSLSCIFKWGYRDMQTNSWTYLTRPWTSNENCTTLVFLLEILHGNISSNYFIFSTEKKWYFWKLYTLTQFWHSIHAHAHR